MKKILLLITLSLVNKLYSQSQVDLALNFQNTIRKYHELTPYSLSVSLTSEAQSWAEYIASEDSLIVSDDKYGETLHRSSRIFGYRKDDYYLDATVGWIIDCDDPGYYQTTCIDCTQVGFGIAENDNFIYVVAKYDKIYE